MRRFALLFVATLGACHRAPPPELEPRVVAGPRITSDPLGLEIRVDGQSIGRRTPAQLETWDPLVSHELELRAPGRVPFKRLLPPGAPPALVEARLPLAARLDVASSPPGARVTSGDREVGRTPLDFALPAGVAQRVEVALDGYLPVRREITAATGETARWSVELPRAGTANVDSDPEGGDVELDGRAVGKAPLALPLEAGPTHRVVVSLRGLSACRRELRVAFRGSVGLRCVLGDAEDQRLRARLAATRARLAAAASARRRLSGPGASDEYLQAMARDRARDRLEDEVDRLNDELDREQGALDAHRTELEQRFEREGSDPW